MIRSKKIRNIISTIKKKKPTKDEIISFVSTFIELMAEEGIHPKKRYEFYHYSQKPLLNLDKLVCIAEDTLIVIEK